MQITEKAIDKMIETTDASPKAIDQFWLNVESQSPLLSVYIASIDQAILTDDEYSQLLYITMIIVRCYLADEDTLPEIESADHLSDLEDRNWAVLDGQKGDFRTRITPFFDNYVEEDLLAFIEDMLVEDEDGVFTPIGREVIFVKSKSIVDWLYN